MVNANKAKGDRFERDIETYCRLSGFDQVTRTRAGRKEDQGDIHLSFSGPQPSVIIQAKDVATPKWREWLTELDDQIDSAGADHGVLVVKRRGSGANKPLHLAVMPLESMLKLLKQAGYGGTEA